MTIRATFPAALLQADKANPQSRTITGLAVPWDQAGRVSDGTTVVFHAGSLDPTARPVALRDHDRTRPIGTVVEAHDTSAGMFATIAVSRVSAGDEALVLAGDGALPALSVGAEPIDYSYDADGTLHVTAAEWLELSLLTMGAFADARVGAVTAAPPGDPMSDLQTLSDAPDEDEHPAPEPPEEEEEEKAEPVETSATVVPLSAGRGRRAPTGTHPYAGIDIRRYSHVIAAAAASRDFSTLARIEASPGARLKPIEAALTDVTLVGTNNVGLMQRPGYQAELIDIVSQGSPAVDVLRQGDLQRGDFPNVSFLRWTLTPVVAEQVTEKTAISTGPVAIATTSVPVKTFATGNDISQQILDFGSPGFVEDYLRVAAVKYAAAIDTYTVAGLMAIATAVTTVTGDFSDPASLLGKLMGGLSPATVPPGPLFLLVSWDVFVSMMGVKETNSPAFWDGNISFGNYKPSSSMGGLEVIVDTNMAARTALMGLRNGATWYDLPGTPFSMRALNPTLLGLDIGVYGYGALAVQYPAAFTKTTIP